MGTGRLTVTSATTAGIEHTKNVAFVGEVGGSTRQSGVKAYVAQMDRAPDLKSGVPGSIPGITKTMKKFKVDRSKLTNPYKLKAQRSHTR